MLNKSTKKLDGDGLYYFFKRGVFFDHYHTLSIGSDGVDALF